MALKDVIRRNRKRLGVSVDEFARLMGIGRATAFRWEAGTREPTIGNLMRLAEFFGVTETELLHPREENEDSKNVL